MQSFTAHRIRVRIFHVIPFLWSVGSVAGPPLSIDDPEILDPGSFEIILAAAAETRGSGNSYLLPIADISYGVSENIQVGAVITRAVIDPDGGSTKSDFGPGALAIKWRFLNEPRLQMSLSPFFEAQLRDGAESRGIADDIEAWVLPVDWQYSWTMVRLNAEVRYAAIHDESDEWAWGVAAAYPATARLEALVELHGGADRRLNDRGLLYRVGIDYALQERLHLLASVGSSIDEDGDEDTNLQAFLGLQWFP